MKKTIFPILLLLTFFISCNNSSKKIENIIFIETTLGGCEDHDSVHKEYKDWGVDTTYYNLENGKLSIFFGATSNCALSFTTDYLIENDTIFMDVETSFEELTSCECYHTFNYLFDGVIKPHKYVVYIDDQKYFSGFIKL